MTQSKSRMPDRTPSGVWLTNPTTVAVDALAEAYRYHAEAARIQRQLAKADPTANPNLRPDAAEISRKAAIEHEIELPKIEAALNALGYSHPRETR